MARFGLHSSPYPDVLAPEKSSLLLAVAGWCFDSRDPDRSLSLSRLARALESEGDAAVEHLQGQYLLVRGDRRSGRMIAEGDGMGLFPWYMAETEEGAWISTSSMALACALKAPLDTGALRGLFMGDAIRAPRSAFSGVRRIHIGETVHLEDGKARIERSWSPFRSTVPYRRIGDAVDEGVQRLRRSTRNIRSCWPRWISALTSGLDSRLVVASMAEPGVPVVVTVNGPPELLDVQVAKEAAARFGWSLVHQQRPDRWGERLWDYFDKGIALSDGEVTGDRTATTAWTKEQLATKHDAAFGGRGGELYREFFWQQEFLRIGRSRRVDLDRLLRFRFSFNARPALGLFRQDWRPLYFGDQKAAMSALMDEQPDALNTAKLDVIYLWKTGGHTNFPQIASPQPLLTRELVEYTTSLPWRYRMHGALVRHLITRLHPRLARVRTWYGTNAEPLSWQRPIQLISYGSESVKKLIRKMSQITLGRAIFPDPNQRDTAPPKSEPLQDRLRAEGVLEAANLRSASLYDAAGLSEFLSKAGTPSFDGWNALFAVLTIEWILRLCDLPAPRESF
jgi:asparagine synthetase B (glutamine-hydrolysing)